MTLPEVFLGPSGVCDVLALALRLAQGSKQILHPSCEKLAAIKGPLVNCCAWLRVLFLEGVYFTAKKKKNVRDSHECFNLFANDLVFLSSRNTSSLKIWGSGFFALYGCVCMHSVIVQPGKRASNTTKQMMLIMAGPLL